MHDVASELLDYMIDVASGKKSRAKRRILARKNSSRGTLAEFCDFYRGDAKDGGYGDK